MALPPSEAEDENGRSFQRPKDSLHKVVFGITRNSWTRNLIFRGLPYTNLDHYIVASMENYALGFLHIAQPTLDKFRSSWHKVRYHHESGT